MSSLHKSFFGFLALAGITVAIAQVRFEPFVGCNVVDAAIPFYVGSEPEPSAVMRVDRIYTDYERKGFFKIGVLPVAVMEGVVVQVHDSKVVTNSLGAMRDWFGSQAGGRLKLHKVAFEAILEGCTNRLEGRSARFISNGQLELFDNIRWRSGTNQQTAPGAVIDVAGKQPGQFVMATVPPLTNNLFVHTEPQSIQIKVSP